MANPLRNAMVYFGLADEETEHVEPSGSHAAPASRPAPVARPVAVETPAAAPAPVRRATPAPVTPIASKRQPPTPEVGEMNEILTVHPKAYNSEAQVIAENFRNGIPVIMNLSNMEDGDARRLIDFASGLTQGLYGRIERVTSRVFLLTPENIDVHGDERTAQGDKAASFFED